MPKAKQPVNLGDSRHTMKVTLRLTPAQYRAMQSIAERKHLPYESMVWREAIQRYIDSEGDDIGSRRLFSKQMGHRIDETRDWLSLMLLIAIKSNVAGFSVLLQAVGAPPPKGGSWDENQLFGHILKATFQDYATMEATTSKLWERLQEQVEKAGKALPEGE